MKIHCRSCGCHFDNDFEETLQPECGMWLERGFSPMMTVEHKKALWDAYFSVPVDAIADDTGVVTTIEMRGAPNMLYTGNQWEVMVPGYADWPDQHKRNFQKAYFKWYYNEMPHKIMGFYLQDLE